MNKDEERAYLAREERRWLGLWTAILLILVAEVGLLAILLVVLL